MPALVDTEAVAYWVLIAAAVIGQRRAEEQEDDALLAVLLGEDTDTPDADADENDLS